MKKIKLDQKERMRRYLKLKEYTCNEKNHLVIFQSNDKTILWWDRMVKLHYGGIIGHVQIQRG
jgi:hypothetical protein